MHGTGRAIQGVAATLKSLIDISVIATADVCEAPLKIVSLPKGIAANRSGAPLHALAVFIKVAREKPQSALPAMWAGVAGTAAGRTWEAKAFREGCDVHPRPSRSESFGDG
jgi:hypothetical protein